jgi:hypothetical protein
MKKQIIFLIGWLILSVTSFSIGQRINKAILSGSDLGYSQIMDFRDNPPGIKTFTSPFPFDENPFYITDDQDSLWMYGNGCTFADPNGKILFTKDSFDLGFNNDYCYFGLVTNQGMILLPKPEGGVNIIYKNVIREIVPNVEVNYFSTKQNVISVNNEYEASKIHEKSDTFLTGYLSACKNKSGGWWVLDQKYSINTYYKYLLKNDSIYSEGNQTIGKIYSENGQGLGSALFSPDGKQYAYSNTYDGVYLFDFDRETGMLSNPRYTLTNNTLKQGKIYGLAFSANSQYLYACCTKYLYQIDTHKGDLEEGLVLVDSLIEGVDLPCKSVFPMNFYKPYLAPDCRIYMMATNGDYCIHVINNPDFPGKGCNVQKSAIKVPYYYYHSLPTYINEMLDIGPPCDSTLPLPVSSREVNLSKAGDLIIAPNPATSTIKFFGLPPDSKITSINITDINGRKVESLKPGNSYLSIESEISIAGLVNGLYFIQIISEAGRFYRGKFVVIRD